MALAALPIAYAAMDDPDTRRSSARFAIPAVLVAALTTGASYGAHLASVFAADVSVSPDTAIYAMPPFSLPYSPLTELTGFRWWAVGIATFAAVAYLFDRLWPKRRVAIGVAALCGITFQLGLLLLIAIITPLYEETFVAAYNIQMLNQRGPELAPLTIEPPWRRGVQPWCRTRSASNDQKRCREDCGAQGRAPEALAWKPESAGN